MLSMSCVVQSIKTQYRHVRCTFVGNCCTNQVTHDTAIVGTSCAAGDLSMNSMCYRKFHGSSPLTWYSANNVCLLRGGFLATFTNIGRPWDNDQLTNWLNTSGTDKTYWIGLRRNVFMTLTKGNTCTSYGIHFKHIQHTLRMQAYIDCPICISIVWLRLSTWY